MSIISWLLLPFKVLGIVFIPGKISNIIKNASDNMLRSFLVLLIISCLSILYAQPSLRIYIVLCVIVVIISRVLVDVNKRLPEIAGFSCNSLKNYDIRYQSVIDCSYIIQGKLWSYIDEYL